MVNTSEYYAHQQIAIQQNPKWGRFAIWLQDNSKIRYRVKGATDWIDAHVMDDRVYYTGAGDGNVYHVTMTTQGSIDFIITTDGESFEDSSYEIDVNV